MTQNPRNPIAIENEETENEVFERNEERDASLNDPAFGRPAREDARLAGDDPMDLEDAVAALDEDDPEELGSGEEHERIPDRTQQRGYR